MHAADGSAALNLTPMTSVRTNLYVLLEEKKMKLVETQIQSSQVHCPHCKAAMQLVRHIDLKGMPDIYIFYCSSCQHVETVKEERAA